MQYRTLLKLAELTDNGTSFGKAVALPHELFRTLLIAALKAKGDFDETFYLAANPDVRDAVRKKELSSAADHYFNTGYFEGKMPKKFVVDEKFYLEQNPDVAKAIKQRKVKSCQLHFDAHGFREGRAPYAGFSLF